MKDSVFVSLLALPVLLILGCTPTSSTSENISNVDTLFSVHFKNEPNYKTLVVQISDTLKQSDGSFSTGEISHIKVRVHRFEEYPIFARNGIGVKIVSQDTLNGVFGLIPLDTSFSVEFWQNYGLGNVVLKSGDSNYPIKQIDGYHEVCQREFKATDTSKVYIHRYEETASDFAVSAWNVSPQESGDTYLLERIDEIGRVTELRFMVHDQLNDASLCYLSAFIKYHYPNDSTVVLTYLNSEGVQQADIECEMPSRVTYHLSKDRKTIKSSKAEFEFDWDLYLQNGWSRSEIENILKDLESQNEQPAPFIQYYTKSKFKLDGIFPISNEFQKLNVYFNEVEKKEILDILNN